MYVPKEWDAAGIQGTSWQQMSCSTCALNCIPLRTVVGDWISEQALCITWKLEQLLTFGDQPDECKRESST